MDAYELLSNAVVTQAVRDYYRALKELQRKPTDGSARYMKDECERWFANDIGLWTDMDGGWIARKTRERAGWND